jgi:TP53 regulating kinase-like protein
MNSAGVNVPGIRLVDAAEGILGIEWVEGNSVKALLRGAASGEEGEEEEMTGGDILSDYGITPGQCFDTSQFVREVEVLQMT